MSTVTVVTSVSPTLELIGTALGNMLVSWLEKLEAIPGGSVIVRYIKKSHQNDPGRTVFEFALFLLLIYYIVGSRTKESKSDTISFSEREIDDLVAEWNPEPLVEPVSNLEKWRLNAVPVIHGHNGAHVSLSSGEIGVANLATNDFLNLNESESIKDAARECIRNVGVGACGPPNFYGTQDVHVRLEEDLAHFLQTEQGILYGQDFVTAGSVIPSFLKRGDLCVVDMGVSLAIQKALIVSRADIEWYNHNDVKDLRRVLEELKPELDRHKKIKRRFIITEAIFANSGDIADLASIVELKKEFKYRVFLDESLSIGVLGKLGRGLPEHSNVPRSDVDITIGSMANAFASSGGFCVGEAVMVHHQRIQSAAYVFSASLPPYSAKVTSQAIKEISENTLGDESSLLIKLRRHINTVYTSLQSLPSPFFEVVSNPHCPVIHLALNPDWRRQLNFPELYGNDVFLRTGKQAKYLNSFNEYYNSESYILQRVIDLILGKANVLVTRSKQILEHENLPVHPPHLLIHVNIGVTDTELAKLIRAVPEAFAEVCESLKSEADLFVLNDKIIEY
ncbi:hypothetical protein DIURU_001981 [Diutina rugosa]|uniref:serine C-palmitoyltransferase n=1 Tax=Diutina rugosa TaxID=5481 RepID=A0A642UTI5_DIURU|nr:uncharacterized protein DIURU_001981 [Diutina rugosa]KAA8904029.1 hypothetical protein DIURU_001981 [Diutina rugosa]